jgi:hypothetical protein
MSPRWRCTPCGVQGKDHSSRTVHLQLLRGPTARWRLLHTRSASGGTRRVSTGTAGLGLLLEYTGAPVAGCVAPIASPTPMHDDRRPIFATSTWMVWDAAVQHAVGRRSVRYLVCSGARPEHHERHQPRGFGFHLNVGDTSPCCAGPGSGDFGREGRRRWPTQAHPRRPWAEGDLFPTTSLKTLSGVERCCSLRYFDQFESSPITEVERDQGLSKRAVTDLRSRISGRGF